MENNLPPARYAAALDRVIAATAETLQDSCELPGIACLVKDGAPTDMIVGAFPEEAAKDGFAEMVRQRASKMKPDAVIIVSEAWSLPEMPREAYRDLKRQYGEIANMPCKLDIVMFKLEAAEGDWIGQAIIEPAGAGRRFGPIQWRGGDGVAAFGRLSNLLPVTYPPPAQVNAYLDLARAKLLAAGIDPDRGVGEGRSLLDTIAGHIRQAPAALLSEVLLDRLVDRLALISAALDEGDA